MRAVPLLTRRSSLRVDSWVRILPSRGNVTCLRSASTRMVPVVNRHARRARCLDLRRGIPIRLPLRLPCLDFA
ncbi:MAG: hypothetical protein QOI83_2728 [Streptomycetaceae bacterium]|nr:hypothetical protein [Streptomycetaceae bacterium]